MSDLNPDEIKVKLDQILDWNDNSNKPKKYVEVDNDRFNRKRISRAKKAKSRCLDKDMINFWDRVIAYFENKLERTIH